MGVSAAAGRAAPSRARNADHPGVAARNYRYGLTGDMPPWKPVAVYVEFPRGIVQGEMPPIFVLGADGEAQIVNSRIHQHILIVDRLFGAAELRLGSGDRQQTVRIVRTDGRPST
ncbi:TrbG/VirB9 family P-type conjugative transfer protein [Aquamicrobium sp. NLF2-7]|uniref:TrbG/VirB9 family P-type conjugative transfer protein n=1 Tax=Aquamicrobium sp. NLF2-7 TaxID=2918753 RepID=UPI001EFAC451|nr:TrbG/VirB9 family P-type conjugative transfer protein [Aquamicrobium sp. NLF2-7]MCG8272690.1 TrbG/VirB9 family P-type conjugative transfer protein [Aquamicrobium sp. NLF2-7]